jgi:hypothetical protein
MVTAVKQMDKPLPCSDVTGEVFKTPPKEKANILLFSRPDLKMQKTDDCAIKANDRMRNQFALGKPRLFY